MGKTGDLFVFSVVSSVDFYLVSLPQGVPVTYPLQGAPPIHPTYPAVPLCLENLCLETFELHISRFV